MHRFINFVALLQWEPLNVMLIDFAAWRGVVLVHILYVILPLNVCNTVKLARIHQPFGHCLCQVLTSVTAFTDYITSRSTWLWPWTITGSLLVEIPMQKSLRKQLTSSVSDYAVHLIILRWHIQLCLSKRNEQ